MRVRSHLRNIPHVWKKAFDTLAQYGQPKTEREKVQILLDQINTNDSRLTTSIGICRDRYANTFTQACTYISSEIVVIYPQHQPNAFGRRGRGGKKPQVRSVYSIKKAKGRVTCNGVDLSDTTKYFTKDEFQKMGKAGRDYLNKCPKRKAFKEAYNRNKKRKVDGDNKHIAAIINGVMQATRHENESISSSSIPSHVSGTGARSARMPQHGTHVRQVNATSQSASQHRHPLHFDHNGDIVPQP